MIAGRALPIGMLILAMVLVQTGASVAKRLFPIVGPEGAVALRLVIAAAILLAVWRPWRWPLTRKSAGAIIAYGVALGVMNLTFYMALRTIPLGVAVALEFTGPLGLALITSRKAVDFLWISLAAAGVILLLPLTPLSAALDPRGVGLALIAGVCWALYIVFGTKAGANGRAQASSLGMLVAALVGAPLGLVTVGPDLLVPTALGLGLAVALLSSAIPYSLEIAAMGQLPTRTFGILMSLEPVVAAVLGLVLLGEVLAAPQWLAIAAIIAASVGSAATSRSAGPAPN